MLNIWIVVFSTDATIGYNELQGPYNVAPIAAHIAKWNWEDSYTQA